MTDVLAGVLDDRDPQAIVDDMVATWAVIAPDSLLRNGSIETLLFEAVAVAAADVIYATNRLPVVVVDALLALYDLAPDPGTAATGSVSLTLDGLFAVTVAAGTRLQDPATGLELEVTTETTAASLDAVTVPVQVTTPGADGNAITSDAALNLLDSLEHVTAATLDGSLSGGADPESETAWRTRAQNVFRRVTSSLVLPEHLEAYCLQDVRVGRALAVDLWDGSDAATIGSDIGHATVLVYGRSDHLSSAIVDELRASMHAISASMLTVHAQEPVITTVDVAATIAVDSGATSADVVAAVQAAITAWMDPMQWEFGGDVRDTDIAAIIAAVPGVDYVVPGTTSPTGTASIGPTALADAGAITITVSP